MDTGKSVRLEEANQQLEKIFATGEFAQAPQLKSFLSYIVSKALSGQQDRIKAYTIATEALGRQSDFDPQADAIVRVQARRLRQALALYYAGPGRGDGIRIELPTGSYVPLIIDNGHQKEAPRGPTANAKIHDGDSKFNWQSITIAALAAIVLLAGAYLLVPVFAPKPPPPAVATEVGFPSVSVAAVSEQNIPGWFNPKLFVSALEEQLSRFDEIKVVEPGQAAADSSRYRADLTFSGSTYFVDGTLRLVSEESGRIVWNGRFDVRQDSIAIYGDLYAVRNLAVKLGQPYGVIYADVLSSGKASPGMACILQGYEYFRRQDRGAFERASRCLTSLNAQFPDDPVAKVLLSYLMLEAYRDGIPVVQSEPLKAAVTMAREAVRLAPESARSHQALMDALSVKGEHEESLRFGQAAVALNPNDTDILADYGCRLVARGRYSEGRTLLSRAEYLSSARPAWQDFCLFVAANNAGDLIAATQYAARLENIPGVLASLATAIAAGRRSDDPAAKRSIAALIEAAPLFKTDPYGPMRKRGWSEEVIGTLVKDLQAAGYQAEK
jgi:tetratricopeptide (TPR) repeat protein